MTPLNPLASRPTFIRWFICATATLAGLVIAFQYGVFGLIFAADASYLSSLIAALFLAGTGYAGTVAWKADDAPVRVHGNSSQVLRALHFLTDQLVTLGLLGTIVGMSITMHGSLSDTLEVQTIINQLKVGTSTALYTTLVGIVGSLLLGLQLFIIDGGEK